MAAEKLPEYRQLIETSESPMALWIELRMRFEDAYRAAPPDDGLIRRFYDYARWCLACPGDGEHLSDAGTAAAYAFFEHLLQSRAIRNDIHRWLTRQEFLGLREVLRRFLPDAEFLRFESEFMERTSKHVRR